MAIYCMNRGFILLDALIGVFIVCSISMISTSVYFNYKNYKQGLNNYQVEVNDRYSEIFNNLKECEKCKLEIQEDSSLQELS